MNRWASTEANAADGGNVEGIARLIFTQYIWAFEVTAALLSPPPSARWCWPTASTSSRGSASASGRRPRTRSAHVPPLPAPGVYARHNAVDTLGLLPDGTPSELTVPKSLTQGGEDE